MYAWGYGPACGVGTSDDVEKPTLVKQWFGVAANNKYYLEASDITEENLPDGADNEDLGEQQVKEGQN